MRLYDTKERLNGTDISLMRFFDSNIHRMRSFPVYSIVKEYRLFDSYNTDDVIIHLISTLSATFNNFPNNKDFIMLICYIFHSILLD